MEKSSVVKGIKPKIPIILASGSESRKMMLDEAGIEFQVITSNVNEEELKQKIAEISFNQQVIYLAKAKAESVSLDYENNIVIGGDQMCTFEGKVFHKPGTKEKAVENLKLLSGKEHFQHSGICIYKNNECIWEYSESVKLKMHDLSTDEINNYVAMENPIYAAGSYKFESLGCNLFSYVNGSSYTVRGMPLIPLLNALRELDIIDLK